MRYPVAIMGTESQRPADIIEKARIQVPGVGTYDVTQPRETGGGVVFGTERQRQSDFVERLQCVAVHCSVLQCVAVCCDVFGTER